MQATSLRQLLPPTSFGRFCFFTLLIVGVFLRVGGLTWGIPDSGNQSSIYHDEGHVLAFVEKSWEDFRKDFGEYEIVRPVYLFRLLGRPAVALGDTLKINDKNTRIYEIGVLRTIPALFGIAGVIAMYGLGKQLGSYKTGLWAMAFLTFMPAHWYYSQILKGDLMVATLFTLILICAISIARSGNRWAYIWGALVLGAGTSFKATTVMAAPILLLAHVLFAWKQKRISAVLSKNGWLFLVITIASFALLYPYPFYNFDQYWNFIKNPALQELSPKFLVSPEEYLAKLQEYHSPTRPFFEMIFGKFLLWVFLPSLITTLAVTAYHLVRRRHFEMLLVIALFVLLFHSLTFSPALDERYVLPFAPFAALFPALVITGFGSVQRNSYKIIGNLVGLTLVISTAAITAVIFPIFAFENPRQQATRWVRSIAPAGATIAQASQTSRWALVFDPSKYTNNSFAYGEEDKRHVAQLVNPDYVIVHQEPWNYDHTFRYELSGVDKEKELEPLLSQYQEKRTFGKVPKLFGMRIPQTLGTPVIHVYSAPKEVPLPEGSYTRLSVEAPAVVTIQSESVPPKLTQKLEEPAVVKEGNALAFVIPQKQHVSVLLHYPREHEIEFYIEREGKRSFYGSGIVDNGARIYAFSI